MSDPLAAHAAAHRWTIGVRPWDEVSAALEELFGHPLKDACVRPCPGGAAALYPYGDAAGHCVVCGEPETGSHVILDGHAGSALVVCVGACRDLPHVFPSWASRELDMATRLPGLVFMFGASTIANVRSLDSARAFAARSPLVFQRAAVGFTNSSADVACMLADDAETARFRYATASKTWYTLDPVSSIWREGAVGEVPGSLHALIQRTSDAICDIARELLDAGTLCDGRSPTSTVAMAVGTPDTRASAKEVRAASRKRKRASGPAKKKGLVEDAAESGGEDEPDDGDDDAIAAEEEAKERAKRREAHAALDGLLRKARASRASHAFSTHVARALGAILGDRDRTFAASLNANGALRAWSDGYVLDLNALRPGAPLASAVRLTTPSDMLSVCFSARWRDASDAIADRVHQLLKDVLDVPHEDAQYAAAGHAPLSSYWLAMHGAILHGDHATTGAQVFLYGYGPTANSGKTSFSQLLLAGVGGLGANTETRVFARAPTDDRDPFLHSARNAVVLINTECSGEVFNAKRINRLTGGGTMKVRTLNALPVEIPSRWAITAVGNDVLKWDAPNTGASRRAKCVIWRKRLCLPEQMDADSPQLPADRRLRVPQDSSCMGRFMDDARYSASYLMRIFETWRDLALATEDGRVAIRHVPEHPLVTANSAEQTRSNPFSCWLDDHFDASEEHWIPGDALYTEYLASQPGRQTDRLGRKQFAQALIAAGVKSRMSNGRKWGLRPINGGAGYFSAASLDFSGAAADGEGAASGAE